MKGKLLLLFCCIALLTAPVFVKAQPQIYNEKNVTQDVLTEHYYNSVPMRVMEYSTDPGGSILERRLEILPENGLPSVRIRTINDLFEEIPYVNQPPFDAFFDNGLFGFKNSVDAATLLFGTEVALKVIKDKFGWIGLDNQAVNSKPIIWNILGQIKPSFVASAYYNPIAKEFLLKSDGNEPEKISHIDVVGHELIHGIIDTKVGNINLQKVSPCSERRVLEEALADIIGVYILNEYEQNSPAFYKWTHGKGFMVPGRSFDDPNSKQQPDTYFGNYYENVCPIDGDFPEHQNATVIDHWYYLLAVGTTGTETNDLGYSYQLSGIGINKAIQIIWNCLDHLNAKTDFKDLKKITLTVTEQLYGLHSTEYLAVMDAWCAVGICENNLGPFYMSPAHGASGVEPWPGVNVNVTWEGLPVDEWAFQMATNTAFTENVQNVLIKNFNVVIKPGGGSAYSGFATGYYRPGERVYARARITKAGANFCKGYNPLCVLYQQYGPAHAFTLDDKQTKFWHAVPGDHWTVNPWNDPSISWKSVANAEQYVYEVAEDDTFTKIVFTGNAPFSGNFSESGAINTPLQPDKEYYTRVRAKRFNTPNLTDNNGAWSETEVINVITPRTSVLQAVNQKPGDPAAEVGSLGFWVGWHPFPGSTQYIIQIATDEAFQNIIRTKTVAGNLSTALIELPSLPDGSYLSVRVLPQNGPAFGLCDKFWRVKTKEATATPLMKSPANGTAFPFNAFLGVFEWKANSLNLNLVHHFEIHFKKKSSNLTSIFLTPDKTFSMSLVDASLFDSKQGFEVAVLAVGPLGAKSALSPPFNYNICPDQPEVVFPVDLVSQVNVAQDLVVKWKDSKWFDPGSTYLVTISDATTSAVVPGFSNKPTTATSMLVPAGTLTAGKKFNVTVKNSSSCAGIFAADNVFSTVGSGGSNQPQPPKLVDFTIELKGYRNDQKGLGLETSDFVLGLKLIDPNGNELALVDPNMNQVTELLVDSENSGVIMKAFSQPQGEYKLQLTMKNIFSPLLYFPFDQPRYSVFLNGNPIVNPHVITAHFLDPGSIFHEWKINHQFADIILDIK
ncbi:Thermolysin metallopeptidase, alpha-helical domain [Dyadobacter sp. SG02]|uniref:M4 family metallopeptidase n=1 Tax=Dyadobacter sp. SG02 TaxID=1855291 RepID=UPI0008B60839|nr:M4 family metallopeptidase [Dyadobacter sp. SG02]SEJ84350.1 Thermolysin metallopeptidase, alpha-helical domain [Dyadobacter sp. SG02]